METLSYILVIAGLLMMFVGIYLVWRPPAAPQVPAGKPQAIPDIGDYLEKIKEILETLDKHVRTGIAVMFFGLTLVVLGLFVADRDTKDAVKDAAPTAPAALVRSS
jgi:uncharacterized membrane protein